MTQNTLKFAIFNNKLEHIKDHSGGNVVCIGCGQPLVAKTDTNSFEHIEVDCDMSNYNVLVEIAKKQLSTHKELCIPTQFINNSFRHDLVFDAVELNQEIDGQFVDLVSTCGDTKVLIVFTRNKRTVNLDEYILEINLPEDGWNFDDYTETLQRLADLVLGDADPACKKWTHMPYPLFKMYGSFNSVKNGVSLDALKVDEYIFNIEEVAMLQGGSASESAQDWFWRKTSVWRQGIYCAWQGLSYASKCRTCDKFGDSRCSLMYSVPNGTDTAPVKTSEPSIPVSNIEYKEDLDF